jgi:hypothetical protein
MEFHNSDSYKKSPPTQTSKLPGFRTRVRHLFVYDHPLLQKIDHSNMLISFTPPKTALFYNLIPYLIRFFPNSGASSFLVSNATEENQ